VRRPKRVRASRRASIKRGTASVPLCGACHAKAHHREGNMSTRELTKAALRKRMMAGLLTGGVPFGWSVDADGNLHPITEEQEAIKLILEMRAAGMTLRAIAEELTAAGVPTKKGRGAWNHNTVAGVVARASAMAKTRWYASTVKAIIDRANLIASGGEN